MEALEEKAGEFNRKRAENEHAGRKACSQIERKRHAETSVQQEADFVKLVKLL